MVVGAGAAGTMAAIFAARAGADTTLLERTTDGGRKILISGGGRCNVLPSRLDESRFVTDSSPNLLRKIVRSWPLAEQRRFFEEDLGVPLVEEPESLKLFPRSQKARDVRDALQTCARQSGARLVTEAIVADLRAEGGRWCVTCDGGSRFEADAVVIATGGLSVPATGSDGRGLALLARLGHTMHATYAALTPLTAAPGVFTELAGISLPVTLRATGDGRDAAATGGFLFTHRGYSGPSVLDVSHVAVRSKGAAQRATLAVQWTALDDAAWRERLQPRGTRAVSTVVRSALPDRLADVLLAQAGVDPARSLSELRREERVRLIDTLVRGPLPWAGDEGYKKAEVTGGGVSLAEVDPRTLQSRRHHGLFVCGESLDAFGPIGGYNFLWAWATGRAAGAAAGAGPG